MSVGSLRKKRQEELEQQILNIYRLKFIKNSIRRKEKSIDFLK